MTFSGSALHPVWLLDCDNTLYPAGNGFFDRVDGRITAFMEERLGLSADRISELRGHYRKTYGVTLGGLIADFGVDPGDYLPYVHDVPLDDLIAPDPLLAEALRALPGERVIFTNGSAAHAARVLDRLGVRGAVGEIYDIAFMDYIPKPRPHGYRKLLDALGAESGRVWLVDDWVENLDTGLALGMNTVLVGPSAAPGHLHIPSPHELPALFSRLNGEPALASANF